MKKHHSIWNVLAKCKELKTKGYEVAEEVTGTADNGSLRRIGS